MGDANGVMPDVLKKENIVPGVNKKINIVAAEFIEYDFVKQIVKDKAEVSMLLPPGVEGHDYQASAKDILTVSNADVFFFSGIYVSNLTVFHVDA